MPSSRNAHIVWAFADEGGIEETATLLVLRSMIMDSARADKESALQISCHFLCLALGGRVHRCNDRDVSTDSRTLSQS